MRNYFIQMALLVLLIAVYHMGRYVGQQEGATQEWLQQLAKAKLVTCADSAPANPAFGVR